MGSKKSPILKAAFAIFLTAVFFVFASGNVSADFIIERENINYRISPDEVARYNVTITNLLDVDRTFSFRLGLGDSLSWIAYPSNVRVPASSSNSFVFSISPNPATPVGTYQIGVAVASGQSKQELSFPIHLSYDGLFFDFVPNVEGRLIVPETLDPRDSARIRVDLRNRNPLNIEDAELRIRSDLFEGTQVINIPPGVHRTFSEGISKELVLQVDPLQKPGDYEVMAQVYYPRAGRVIVEEKETVTITGYSSTPSKLETERSFLFIVTHTISVENFGNRDAVAEIKLASSWFKNIFSSMSHDAEFERTDRDSNLVWTINLKPTQKDTIVVTTNYWPLVIVLLILLLAIVIYFRMRSPVVLEKEVAVIDGSEDEGSSDLRVRLFVKNRSSSSVNSLVVSDKVRGITNYVESTQIGHVKPSRSVKTSKKGTMLYWDIEELEPYEERIFTYNLKSKLRVVGELTLPRAKAKFEGRNNRERKIESGKPSFKKIKKKKVE